MNDLSIGNSGNITISSIVHELANISNGLNLNGERLRMVLDRGELESARSAFQDVNRESLRLVRLVEGLRKTELISEVMDPQSWAVPDVLTLALARAAESHRNSLEICVAAGDGEVPRAICDPTGLATVLQELLGNAAQFRATLARITVASVDDQPVIRVVDDGDGIPEAMQPRVFNMFTSTLKHQGHLGLGLWRAKSICTRMSAQLSLSDSQPGYTCFELRLTVPAAEH